MPALSGPRAPGHLCTWPATRALRQFSLLHRGGPVSAPRAGACLLPLGPMNTLHTVGAQGNR